MHARSGCIVKRRRDVDQVPELLGGDPHLVQSRGRGVFVDVFRAAGDSPAQPPGALRDDICQKALGISALGLGGNRSVEERLPVQKQPAVAFAVQRGDERVVFLTLHLAQEGHQRLHVGGWNIVPVLSERENQHVNVAQRAGEATQPRELRGEVFGGLWWEHVLDLAKQRARASERHAEVVEKLGIEVRAKAGLVGHEDADQRTVDLTGADVRADRRVEV